MPLVILISSKYPLNVSLPGLYAPIFTALDKPKLLAVLLSEVDKDTVPLINTLIPPLFLIRAK
jgi:hypothetical protein